MELRNLWRHEARPLWTLAGIALGIIVVVALLLSPKLQTVLAGV
jgi:hypothetical protein